LELSDGADLSLLVSWASLACSFRHDTAEFSAYLRKVLTFDLERAPENRFANEVALLRARTMLSKIRSCVGNQQRRPRSDHVGFRVSGVSGSPAKPKSPSPSRGSGP
jgi:hypothetical protein